MDTNNHITLYQSNKTENLLDSLIHQLKTPISNPLAPETIVVQSKGMERWISLKIAERLGCCANIHFPFPNKFVQSLFAYLLPDLNLPYDRENPRAFDLDVMTWKLVHHLQVFLDQAPFKPLANYLNQDAIMDLKKVQLCERIADTFEQYMIYRPDIIHAWENGQDDHWQAILWRFLTDGISDYHMGQLGQMAVNRMFSHQYDQPFAERIFVFGISSLPAFHIQMLVALSRLCQVHVFILNPSHEYWGEIRSRREISKLRMKEKTEGHDLYLEEGHPLLASMGKMGRDFLNLLFGFMDDPQIHMDFKDHFQPVHARNLLTHVQSQLFDLKVDMPTQIEANDSSINVHACHSPMREVEVLYDQLLHMFETDPALKPQDILVMTPDIETYAPLIQGVFDNPDQGNAIPYSISDRTYRNESQIMDAFFMILDLPGSRLEATAMLSILECPAVARRFNISPDDMPLITHWLEQTRLRWGQSGKFRKKFGMGAYSENTWQNSLDRLLLGYAMPGEKGQPFSNILPFDAVEGQSASIVGHLVQWANTLFKIVRLLDTSRNLIDWVQALDKVLDDCFLPFEEEDIQFIEIRKAIHRLKKIAIQLNPENQNSETIHFSAIKWYLSHTLEKPRSHMGFLSGNVTCCAMLPMRAIPFKVICMIGLNDIAYPRRDRSPNFDLIAQNPRPGDRSLRNDDRYIFLEAILSARQRLYMSYVGLSISDNSLRPPSVLVSELLDYLDAHFIYTSGTVRENIMTYHRLQAFNPEYFNMQSNFYSYSKENCDAAATLHNRSHDKQVSFVSQQFTDGVNTDIHISELLAFYKHPIQYYFNYRLGVYLFDKIKTFERREPFQVSGLDKYWLKVDILHKILTDNNPYIFLDQTRARGILPLGQIGCRDYYDIIEELSPMAKQIHPLVQGPKPNLSVDLKIDHFRLHGNLHNCFEKGLVFYRPAQIKADDYLQSWLYHLILNLQAGATHRSFFVGSDHVFQILPVENSRSILLELLLLYEKGLCFPIHFFPKTSYAFIEAINKGKSENDAITKAKSKWLPNRHSPMKSESEDPYHIRYFQFDDPLDDSFVDLSKKIFLPMNSYLKTGGI